ncbi:MAG: hypothetical protein JKX76_01245 [Colwellia sp.]|nr:hypothetical protein [Colwellia sp.]
MKDHKKSFLRGIERTINEKNFWEIPVMDSSEWYFNGKTVLEHSILCLFCPICKIIKASRGNKSTQELRRLYKNNICVYLHDITSCNIPDDVLKQIDFPEIQDIFR